MAPTSQIFYEASDTVPIGEVIRTDPAEGEILTDPDQVVKIYISSGPAGAGGSGGGLPAVSRYNGFYQY